MVKDFLFKSKYTSDLVASQELHTQAKMPSQPSTHRNFSQEVLKSRTAQNLM